MLKQAAVKSWKKLEKAAALTSANGSQRIPHNHAAVTASRHRATDITDLKDSKLEDKKSRSRKTSKAATCWGTEL